MISEQILVIEDEPVVALDLQQSLLELGHSVTGIGASFEEAMQLVAQTQPSMVFMDIHIDGDRDGIETCREIYQRWKLPVIFLTAYADDETVERAAGTRPFGYVMKPFENKELQAVIQVARSRHDAEISLSRSEQRLAVALEAAEMGSWEWDAGPDHVQGDARFHQLLGLSLRPVQAGLQELIRRVHPDDQSQVQDLFRQSGYFHHQFRVQRRHHEFGWLEIYGKLQRNAQGQELVIGALRDITLRKTMEENLRQASVVFSTAAEGMLILSATGHILNANPAFSSMTGFSLGDVIGRQPQDFLMVRREADPSYAQIAASPEGYWTCETCCRRKDGSLMATLQHVCAVRNETGSAEQFVLSISDISFIREAERQLEHLAFHDPLTGLGNRYLLDQRLMQELSLANGQQACLAILFIDLDGFKAINDSMGHHVGDKLIQEVARRIQSQIRRHDEAIRLGGDEFVVILPNLTNQSDARLVAEKMLRQIAEPIQIDEHALRVSASIGIASYPRDGLDLNTLLSAADSAMYAAKHQGKGRACEYVAEMTDYVRTRLQTEQSLHHALERQELQLYYQPVMHLNSGRLAGFEALLRWQHPVSGLLSPDQFIPVAEESGLIEPIGTWVLEQALQQIQIWQQMTQRPLFMAVNVSPRQFVHADFAAIVQQALQRCQLSGESLEIEITESILQDFQRSKRIVEALRTLGCTVAIDDFGTGYSSVSLLRHLPVSRIKIDRSFVSALPGRAQDTGLVSAMLGMAHSLGLEVTAEGIETAEQAAILAGMANMAAQGYYFERPHPAEFFTAGWLSRHLTT